MSLSFFVLKKHGIMIMNFAMSVIHCFEKDVVSFNPWMMSSPIKEQEVREKAKKRKAKVMQHRRGFESVGLNPAQESP